ncbi:type I-C CRISPR-associated endonuclease Cas1c [Secundilactobacillus similis DSM 23365 = JCM 2765]|nr:type I-C CRISPR-associated endonuclease Cas1c [Secundilactobacillus similis]
MRRLLNTLYITQPESYLMLDGGNVSVSVDHQLIGKIPLINLEGIVTFGRAGASPALMQECLSQHIALSFLSPHGKFIGRVVGPSYGNVVLRKTQYARSFDKEQSCEIARNFIIGKLYNQRWQLERMTRDHGLVVDVDEFKAVSKKLNETLQMLSEVNDLETLRGIEGNAATQYFALFPQMVLQQRDDFKFNGRNRRPPKDRVNALLSFAYTLLAHDVASALETVGLDAYVGFMHQDRPGRMSLALDVMEELRGVFADRFVLRLINRQVIKADQFVMAESGAVTLKDDARKLFLSEWQKRKQEQIVHPYLGEKIMWGLVPFCQAMLLARYLRGDLDEYPPFLWK